MPNQLLPLYTLRAATLKRWPLARPSYYPLDTPCMPYDAYVSVIFSTFSVGVASNVSTVDRRFSLLFFLPENSLSSDFLFSFSSVFEWE
jgi:hypothetical protein